MKKLVTLGIVGAVAYLGYFFRDDGTLAAVRANVHDVTQAAPTARVYKISTFNTYGKDDLPPAGTVAYVPEQSVISTSYGP